MAGSTSEFRLVHNHRDAGPTTEMACLADLVSDVFAKPGWKIDRRFTRILDGACAAYGMAYAYITMTGARACSLRFSSSDLPDRQAVSAPAAGDTTTNWIAEQAAPIAIFNGPASLHAKLRDQLGHLPGVFLGAPIIFDGRVYGTLELVGKMPRAMDFTDIELSTIRMISTYAATPLVLLGQR